MASPEPHAELMEKILNDGLSPEQEQAAVESCARARPAVIPSLLSILLGQKQRYKILYEESEAKRADLAKAVLEPPWHPAMYLGTGARGRALVVHGGRPLCVGIAADVDPDKLRRGCSVLLNGHLNMLVDLATDLRRTGTVGLFSRFHGERQALLRGPSDEEFVVDLAEDLLAGGLANGDQLVFDREARIAWDKIATVHQHRGLLEELPLDVRIEELGGVRQVFDEILGELKLHLFHPDEVARYRLPRIKGQLLCGPPGTGKTSLVQALANHLIRVEGVDVKAYKVPPGGHRVMWFGQSEKRVKGLFRAICDAADEAPGRFIIAFFDDMDTLGGRENQMPGDIDARLMPCFLQEVDNIRNPRIMLIGATNMESRLDDALIRPGRFGAIHRVGRPGREQAREIFSCHLTSDLPLAGGDAPQMIDQALAALYAPNGELATLATLTFRDGTRRPLTASQVMSGALIAAVVGRAKRRACYRGLDGASAGIASADLMASLAAELTAVAARLRPGASLTQMLGLPQDMDVVRVEPRSADAPLRAQFLRPA
ncbi:MAG TPA: AAA family ATPase [Bryobacteraceae bacterium]|nr:AAA family ATPase [Bryobacteraceae bacterium]